MFNPSLNAKPSVYTDIIEMTGSSETQSITKDVLVVLEIESELVFFDASLDLQKKTFSPGEEAKATITIYDLKGIAPSTEVTLIHTILDANNNIIYEVEEKISIDERASFSKSIPLSETIPPGQYIYALKVIYLESFASATEIFTIEEKPSALVGLAASKGGKGFLIAVPVMATVIVGILFALYFTQRKIRKGRTTIIRQKTIKTIIRPRTIIKPIIRRDVSGYKRKLALLREGYRRGFIKADTYRKGKEKLHELMRR